VDNQESEMQTSIPEMKNTEPIFEIKKSESLIQEDKTEYPLDKRKGTEKSSPVIEKKESIVTSDSSSLESVIATLSGFVAQTVGLDSTANIDQDKLFSEMGIDSIMGIEFRVKLEKEYKTKLSETVIADEDTNTIEKLAKQIVSLLKK
jgi:acyl carrier protein